MQVSDVILGLLIILLVGWTMMIALEQRSLNVSLNALGIRQVAQSVLVSPENCKELQGYELVQAAELQEKEYHTTVGFDGERKHVFLCFYEEAGK